MTHPMIMSIPPSAQATAAPTVLESVESLLSPGTETTVDAETNADSASFPDGEPVGDAVLLCDAVLDIVTDGLPDADSDADCDGDEPNESVWLGVTA